MDKSILLGHGSGGKLSHDLIAGIFLASFDNDTLGALTDSAVVDLSKQKLAFTTDSFVVDPVFFPGGDIGKLAVAGTVNDLAVSGAKPLYMSSAFILEEGFPISSLETIVRSMKDEADRAGIKIVTGDTKVVHKGKCDKIFINTSGIGTLEIKHAPISTGAGIQAGDKIIINGAIADHGMSVLAAREFLNIRSNIQSDCASLNHMIQDVLTFTDKVRFMRDATRGGLATVLAELAECSEFGIMVDESLIPVNENVRGMCELLGYDPLYVANEGKVVMIAANDVADQIVEILRKHPEGKRSSIIGSIEKEYSGKAWLQTSIGGKRILDMLAGEQLPRIC